MTTNTPQQTSGVKAKCQKCGSQAKSVEYDILGMVITCAICGKCVYMDRNNQPVEEQQQPPLKRGVTGFHQSRTPVKTAPGTAEIQQGYNPAYQRRQQRERSLKTAIDEHEESEMETETNEVEESKMETETNEVEESKIETETNEVEEPELETETNEVEAESETRTSEMEESKMETVTNEAEAKPETKTNEVEESKPEAETNEAEKSERETVSSEAEKSEPETVTSEAEETKQPATSTAGKPKIKDDGCPNCGKPKDLRDIRRFQRTALRQCTTCLIWEINPEQKRKLGNQDLAIGIGLQMNFHGATNIEIQEKANLLTGNLHIGRSSMHYWIRRYAKTAMEKARKLQVVNSSGDWELDIVSLEYRTQQHYCWSITDSRTQYILATERTNQLSIGEELFKIARHNAGHEPNTILLRANMKKDIPGLAEQARTATLIQRSPSEENSDSSMARLRNGVTKRIGSARGEFNQVTMEYVLGALAMSINLFEQSEQLDGQTPAEAAGIQTPYRNWEDMVAKTKITNSHATSKHIRRKKMVKSQDAAELVETTAEGQNPKELVEITAEGQNPKELVEITAEGQDPAELVETTAEGQDPAESVETMAEGQKPAESVETMAEGQKPAESVETMAGEEYKTIAEELREILKELEQHSESLIREYDQTVRDQQAMKRTIEILNKEQPAVNGVSQETPPVA